MMSPSTRNPSRVRPCQRCRFPTNGDALDILDAQSELLLGVHGLPACLHLFFGLSRASVNFLLKFLPWLLLRAVRLGAMLRHFESLQPEDIVAVPSDIRTILSLNTLPIEPVLRRDPCCPRCFRRFKSDRAKVYCEWRATRLSRCIQDV
jgi:hypothetical protein